MAQSPLGNFANLSRYQQAPTQTQANVLDQFIQALNQGVSLAQLPQTIQQENQLKQQQLILGNLKAALAQQQLTDLQNPEQALARKFKQNLLEQSLQPTTGVVQIPTNLSGETIYTPNAITSEQQVGLDQGGVLPPPTAPGAPITPILGVNGAPTSFGRDIQGQTKAVQQEADLQSIINAPKNAQKLAELKARYDAAGIPVELGTDVNGNSVLVPKVIRPGSTPQVTALTAPGSTDPLKLKPKVTAGKASGITGNETAKLINEASSLGLVYNSQEHGDLSDPGKYAAFRNQVSEASDAQGAVTDPKLKILGVRVQQSFNREPVVATKKNLEIFGREAADALKHVIDHPDEPAGARQIEAFDSFIKAFSAGKPTIAQYATIGQYQSAEDYFLNLFDKLQTGKQLTNEELKSYSDTLRDASASIDVPYQAIVKKYRDELGGFGFKPGAAKKVIQNVTEFEPSPTPNPTTSTTPASNVSQEDLNALRATHGLPVQ